MDNIMNKIAEWLQISVEKAIELYPQLRMESVWYSVMNNVSTILLCSGVGIIIFMFVDALEKRYSQIEFDTTLEEFKHAWLGTHSIFMHHGDKVKNPTKLHQIMTAQFAKEWGESQSRYLITGHFHHEKSLSFAGVTWYQLQSPSKHSSYDKTNGFDTSESGQMLFEFSETKRSAVYYV